MTNQEQDETEKLDAKIAVSQVHIQNKGDDGLANYDGYAELLQFEEYMGKYNEDIIKKIITFAGSTKIDVLDFGAGIGTLLLEWEKQEGIKPIALEIDPAQARTIRNRGFQCIESLEEIKSKRFDVVYSSNVLEHIEDDNSTLSLLRSLLKENGVLILYLPAFMCLWSDLDTKVGHFRRYSKVELVTKLTNNGFEIDRSIFVDSVGFFASLTIRLLGYNAGHGLASNKSLQFYDTVVYGISSVIDKLGLRFVFGKNIMISAKLKRL